ncbi:MAG TPA: DNA gyrase subunit A [Patescibacteria group bacterium]|nr:DNA gyrase subunit A [Patescibacteria group bacterium]
MPKDSREELSENIGVIKQRFLEHEMQESYLDYAMTVIVSRALPDVRDGLKPVHRRILYAMQTLGLRHTGKTRKSATVVGEVLGKYHPHGDTAVYDSMVHMAQEFAMRYPLIIGQGNFGSMDGDGAAAMRYTEAKMSAVAGELLEDLDKDTVDFRDNYDATIKEPSVLPGKLPNLLLNGTLGIAVGMATNIPPHNLTEIANAINAIIENPEISLDELSDIVTGPDFPTGGIIYDRAAIKNAYATGKGGIVMRGRTEIEETKTGSERILITEIPYQVNKATMLQRIADLVRDKKLEGIKDVRDESDKDGVRIVVDLKKEALSNKILNQLFSYTQLQETFHMNTLALEEGIQPMVMNIKTILEKYLEHRQNVVRRRTEFELRKAKEREHILEGLSTALDHIDEVIKIIRGSDDRYDAQGKLMKKFKLTEIQTNAILDMRLQTLAGLERKKIEDELKEKKKLIAELEGILSSKKKILSIIKEEVTSVRDRFGDERRTQIVPQGIGQFNAEDLIPENNVIISITKSGYIKRQSPDTYRSQARGGKGVIGQSLKDEDIIDSVLSASTHDDIMFFTNKGRVFVTKVYEIPESSRTSKGQALVNFLQLGANEISTGVLALEKKSPAKFLVMSTRNGLIKKVSTDEFIKVRKSGMIAIGLKGDDELRWVKASSGNDEIMLSTEDGQAIRFKESDIRAMGRAAAGVGGMRLKKGDHIISMDIITKDMEGQNRDVLVVTEHGLGKKTPVKDYKVQKRAGSGIKTVKITEKTGKIVSMCIITPEDAETRDLLIISKQGQTIKTPIKTISTLGRATQGVKIMRLADGDTVASATVV